MRKAFSLDDYRDLLAEVLERLPAVLLVNGAQLRLDPLSQAVVIALRDHASLRFDALCACLGNTQPDAVLRAVLDLARHDVVSIQS